MYHCSNSGFSALYELTPRDHLPSSNAEGKRTLAVFFLWLPKASNKLRLMWITRILGGRAKATCFDFTDDTWFFAGMLQRFKIPLSEWESSAKTFGMAARRPSAISL